MLLRAGPAPLLHVGDRMWPAIRDGETVVVRTLGDDPLARGEVVLCCPGGIPDLLRVEHEGPGGVVLRADADPGPADVLPAEEILGRASLSRERPRGLARIVRRVVLDVREAVRGCPDAGGDAAETVRAKYDAQEPFYSAGGHEDLDPAMRRWVRSELRPGGRMLVAGSGTGRECFALAGEGFDVIGVDFAPAMIAASRREAERRGLAVEFIEADLRSMAAPDPPLDGVLFTYDVFSFIPDAGSRIRLLGRVREWLAPGGLVFLSARRVAGSYERLIFTIQWLSHRRRRALDWGASHTRWISSRGNMHRSFVQVFTSRMLRREVEEAGFRQGASLGGHVVLARRGGPVGRAARMASFPSRLGGREKR